MQNNGNLAAENKGSKVKKVFFPAMVLAASFYYSMFAVGILLGYLASKLYYDKIVATGKVAHIFVDFGKWKFHFHHWMMGAIVLVAIWFLDRYYLPQFFVGVIGGIIAHDIYDFNDWHQILVKNEKAAMQK